MTEQMFSISIKEEDSITEKAIKFNGTLRELRELVAGSLLLLDGEAKPPMDNPPYEKNHIMDRAAVVLLSRSVPSKVMSDGRILSVAGVSEYREALVRMAFDLTYMATLVLAIVTLYGKSHSDYSVVPESLMLGYQEVLAQLGMIVTGGPDALESLRTTDDGIHFYMVNEMFSDQAAEAKLNPETMDRLFADLEEGGEPQNESL